MISSIHAKSLNTLIKNGLKYSRSSYGDMASNSFAFCLVCLGFVKLGYIRSQHLAVASSGIH
jgi:hypothetical protein